MQNTTLNITAADLNTARKVVLRVGVPESSVEDIVQDAVVAALSGGFDPAKGTAKNYLAKTAKNLAINWRKRACNRNHDSVAMTDHGGEWDNTSAGDTAEGVQLVAPEFRSPELNEQIDALDALDGDERAFVKALALGHTATEAAALVGWSNAKATRKRREIAKRIGR
jgi:DNA-directed RNA polymerase specialized sigma24 family protein